MKVEPAASGPDEHPRRVLARLGISPRKRRGQHFLTDRNILGIQVAAAGLEPGERVLEIGPGLGILTRQLLRSGAEVTAVEKDEFLFSHLQKTLSGSYPNLRLIKGDFLEQDLGPFDKTVSNIPYNISSPITFRLRELEIATAVLMYQYEFAQRLVAECGTGEYSRLSVMVRHDFRPTMIKRVSRNVFYPRPKVDSAIVRLERVDPEERAEDYGTFKTLVRTAFSTRRKKIRNSLRNSGHPDLLCLLSDPSFKDLAEKRPGEITLSEYIMMANRAYNLNHERARARDGSASFT